MLDIATVDVIADEMDVLGFSRAASLPPPPPPPPPGPPGPQRPVGGTSDFYGDGKSDVLWQNDNGQVYEWQMNGMSVAAAGFPGINTDPAWHVVGTGDYNGDGKADILWQDSHSGQVYQWQMNGMSVASAGFAGTNTNTAWHVTAAG